MSTTRLVDKAFTIVKYHIMCYCGPFVLVECILSGVYYNEIVEGCQKYIYDQLTVFVIFAIIIVSCVSAASCLCFTYMSIIGIRAGVRALPSMWDVNKWQVERQRMIEENRSRYRPAIEIENLQRAIEIQEIERRNYIIS